MLTLPPSGDLTDLFCSIAIYSCLDLFDSSLWGGPQSSWITWFSHHPQTLWQSRLHSHLPDSGTNSHHKERRRLCFSLRSNSEFNSLNGSWAQSSEIIPSKSRHWTTRYVIFSSCHSSFVTQKTFPRPMTCSSLFSTVGLILLWQHSLSVFTLKDMISLLIWWHALLLLKLQWTSWCKSTNWFNFSSLLSSFPSDCTF